jgi:hypothetical protein
MDRIYDAGIIRLYRGADKSLARPWKERSYSETKDRIYDGGTIRLYRGADKSLARTGRNQAKAKPWTAYMAVVP